ncbi:MAG TPA: tetratricopeptide repeat protein [Fibrobacteria bacterium]|nr:tetratricopeptide repeat protein [Fibrobacteria bacterium]
MSSTPLATWNGGNIDQFRWDNWKKNANLSAADAKDLKKGFDDYLGNRLAGQAAMDAGITKDSLKAKRWESIVDRILSDLLRREFLMVQAGFPDSAIRKWASTQDSAVQRLPFDTLRVRGGEALLLKGVDLDSVYKATKADYKKDSIHYAPFDSVRNRVRESAYHTLLDNLVRSYVPNLRKQYKVELISVKRPPTPVDTLKAYWKANAERWSTTTTYDLVALGSKDSTSLAKAVAGAKTLEQFEKLSAKFHVGAPVAPNGVLGRVKHQFALPYGIGMVPELFSRIDTVKVGHVLVPFRANDSLFMAVWLEGRDTSVLKPFESIRNDVQAAYDAATPYSPPAGAVVAKWDKGNLFTQGDVDFIAQEVPDQMKRQFPSERVLDFMLNWKVSGRNAREVGFAGRPDIQGSIDDNEKIYWAQEFRKGSDAQTFFFPKKAADSALGVWLKSVKVWAPDSSKGIDRDGSRLLLLAPGEIASVYAKTIDQYRTDSTFQPFDSCRSKVFARLIPSIDVRGAAHVDSVLRSRYHVVVSSSAPAGIRLLPAKVALDSARALHDRRSLLDAKTLYTQVADDDKAPDSLRAQALFQLGQLAGEQQEYPQSLESYRTVLLLYPKSNEAYKAQFMIGFTYSEYLKINKIAVEEYRKVLANYPKCDLASDADWMVRNILSGGALMPKFDDSAFVADSTARADSLKKANIKGEKPKTPAPSAPGAPAPVSKPVGATGAKVDSTHAVASKPKAGASGTAGAK